MALAIASTPPLSPDPLQLKRRLTVQGGGFALLLLVAFSGSLYWGIGLQRVEDQRTELRQIAASAATQLPLIAHEAGEAAGTRKFRAERRVVGATGLERQRVQWFGPAGQLLSEQGALALPPALLRPPATSRSSAWQRWPGGLSLWQPVYTERSAGYPERQLSGFVRVALSDGAARRDLYRLKRGLLLGGLVSVLAALMVSRRMLKTAFAPLQQQVEALQRFTADASHELRHPLTAMRTLLAAVPEPQRHAPDSPWRDLEILAARMAEQLEDLLFLARQEQGGGAGLPLAERHCFDLLELLDDLLRLYASQADRRGVELRLCPPPGLSSLPISGQPEHLLRLFTNLLLNAIRHSPEGGTVALQVMPLPHAVRVEVVDGGPGIGAEEQEQVFERFWRGSSQGDQGAHSGLGLAIARSIARGHGGELRLGESRPGRCVLVVELPTG
jgi:signal transduction histidine kinase